MVSVSDFAGKSCETASDCPEPYLCVAARPGAGRTCEVLAGPSVGDPSETGPVPQYCGDIQPILAANCVSTCHGADNTNGTTGFRLDYYEPEGEDLPPGARAKADRIKARAADFRTMPPPGHPVQPSEAERALLSRWARGGAPFCEDAGTPDGGGPDGGGSPDGGSPDAGADAGR
jgi:hypothetical protein